MTETTDTPGTGDAAPTQPSPATPVAPETIAAMKGAKTARPKSIAEVLANQSRGAQKAAAPEDPTMPKPTKTSSKSKTKTAKPKPNGDMRTFAIRVTPQVQASIHNAAKAAGLSGTEWATNVLVKAAAK